MYDVPFHPHPHLCVSCSFYCRSLYTLFCCCCLFFTLPLASRCTDFFLKNWIHTPYRQVERWISPMEPVNPPADYSLTFSFTLSCVFNAAIRLASRGCISLFASSTWLSRSLFATKNSQLWPSLLVSGHEWTMQPKDHSHCVCVHFSLCLTATIQFVRLGE